MFEMSLTNVTVAGGILLVIAFATIGYRYVKDPLGERKREDSCHGCGSCQTAARRRAAVHEDELDDSRVD